MINPFIDENGKDIFPYQPLRSVVFILVVPEREMWGNFYIPEMYKKDNSDCYGIVVGVGKGEYIKKFKKWIPTSVKVGDVVAYNAHINDIWEMMVKAKDGKEYRTVYCGEYDLQGYFPQNKGV